MVDDPYYIGQEPLRARSTPGGDIPASPSASDQRDSTDMNPTERADKGKAKEPPTGDLQCEFEEPFNAVDDSLMGDRYAHALADEVCTDFPPFGSLSFANHYVGQHLQRLIREQGKDKHRRHFPFKACQIPTGYEAFDQNKRLIAHFSAIGLRRAVIKMLAVFGYEAIKSVMGAGGAASEHMLASVTALVSLNLINFKLKLSI